MRKRLADEADVRRRAEEAEAALGRARHRFERLVRSTVVPAVVTDGGRCIDASPAFLELVGHGAEELAAGVLRWDTLALPAERPLDERAATEAREHGAASPYERTLEAAGFETKTFDALLNPPTLPKPTAIDVVPTVVTDEVTVARSHRRLGRPIWS